MNKEKILNFIGLAQRAGALVSGDLVVEKALKARKVCLLLLANDVATNNEDKYKRLAETYKVPLVRPASKEELGTAIGKDVRVVIGITNDGFGQAIEKLINQD